MILWVRTILLVLCQSCTVYFLDLFEGCNVDSFWIIYPSCRITYSNNFCTKLLCFFCSVNCNISWSWNCYRLTCKLDSIKFQKFLCQIQKTISCCFCTCKRSTVCKTFSCKNTFIQSTDSLVLTEHISDLSCTCTDISCRNISISTNIFTELCHKALAECHYFSVRFSLRIEIRSTFTSADRKSCKRVLENLLKTKEFDNTKVYGWMKTKTSFVWSDRTVELYTVSCINLYLSVIIYPRNTEFDLSFRLYKSLKKSFFAEFFFICLDHNTKRFQYLFYCLMEFRLSRVFLYD